MLAHHLSSDSPPDSDQRHQRASGQDEQLELLIAAGLVAPDARLDRKKKKKGSSTSASKTSETGMSQY